MDDVDADVVKLNGLNCAVADDQLRRWRMNVGGEQPGCICADDERHSGGADRTEMLSNVFRGKVGEEGLKWHGGEGVGLPIQPAPVDPTIVDSWEEEDNVDVGVEQVGVLETSLGAQRMSLHAGSVPSPTRMSW